MSGRVAAVDLHLRARVRVRVRVRARVNLALLFLLLGGERLRDRQVVEPDVAVVEELLPLLLARDLVERSVGMRLELRSNRWALGLGLGLGRGRGG